MISRMIDCVSVTQKQLRKAQSLEESAPKINKEISLIMAFIEIKVDKVIGFSLGTAVKVHRPKSSFVTFGLTLKNRLFVTGFLA